MAGLLLGLAWVAAPLLPLAYLIAGHLVIGSGRWANLPPAGMGLPLITTVAILISLCALRISRKPARTSVPKWPVAPLVAAGVLLAWALTSLFWSPSAAYGLNKVLRFGVLDLLPAYAVYTALRLGLTTTPAIVRATRWATLAVTLFGLGYAVLTAAPDENARLSAGGTDPITFGLTAGLGLLLWVLPVEGDRRNTLTRVIRLVAIVACVVGLIGSNSKGPILSVLVAFLALALRSRSRAAVGRVVAVACVGLLVVLLAPATYTTRLDPSLYATDDSSTSQSILVRQELEDAAVGEFVQHPLTGVGSGGFNQLVMSGFDVEYPIGGSNVSYPHLVVLEVAAELGLVGLALLALVAISAVRVLRRGRASDWAFVMVVLGTTESFFSGDLSDQRWVWFGLALGAGDVARRMALSARNDQLVHPTTATHRQGSVGVAP